MSDFFTKTKCDRCGGDLRASTMSRFNTDAICMACSDDEHAAPGYAHAAEVELAAVQAKNYNYQGVGLSAADHAFLAERRAARKAAK